jgi:hypothetical protein
MKHYLSPAGQLFAYESNGSQDDLIPPDFVLATDSQVQAIQNPVPTLAQVVFAFESAVQAHLDTFAATWRYESILSAASYANSTVPSFKAEALALMAWRDQVWAQCYTELAAVQAGTQPMPASPSAFIATLPASPTRP